MEQLTTQTLVLIAAAAAVGFILGAIILSAIHKAKERSRENKVKDEARRLIDKAKREAHQIKRESDLELKDKEHKMRLDFENSTKDTRRELKKEEERIEQKKAACDKRADQIEQKEQALENDRAKLVFERKQIDLSKEKVEKLIQEEEAALQRVAGLSREEAIKSLREKLEREVEYDAANLIRRRQQEAEEQAHSVACDIIARAIQRCASEYVAENTVASVSLPSDDLKGRIIGREGRNIRALEQETGVEILIDDTPNAVVISGFDPVRREIAKRTLERLIADGRIHPARIEEVLNAVRSEIDQEIEEAGQKACLDLGISGLHPELVKLVGRLKFRTSYGQNLLAHSIEVSKIMGALSTEMREDPTLAKRAGLLHDIGKAVDHEVEGPHASIGAELARHYQECDKVVNAIAAHHNETEAKSRMAVLCSAADAISAARPGARSEAYDTYLRRIEQLEKIAGEIEGVQNAFAVQAGRELRVIVDAESIDDNKMLVIARDIAKRVSDEVQFPGQIKVCVVRETRVVEYAK
ncbi:ribonuclease Y [bacterium]|nr:ribonuclease Y [bacterium]MBR6463421.1 ribonuclease Y [bacterium]